jgi:hypothetical protein
MNLKHCATTFLVFAGMAALPATSLAAESHACAPGKPTPQSYTWDFRGEASRLLNDIQVDAAKAQQHASKLDVFAADPLISWQTHAGQLASIRREVNDMGRKLCRLEVIRRVVAPWQQEAIDRTAPSVRLMADNAEDALVFLNNNQGNFWQPDYQKYVANLDQESGQVSHSVKTFEEYAKVHSEDLHLRKELGTKAGS